MSSYINIPVIARIVYVIVTLILKRQVQADMENSDEFPVAFDVQRRWKLANKILNWVILYLIWFILGTCY